MTTNGRVEMKKVKVCTWRCMLTLVLAQSFPRRRQDVGRKAHEDRRPCDPCARVSEAA